MFQQMHGSFQQMHKAPAQRTVLPAALLSLVCLVPRLRERPRLRLRPAVLFTLKLLVLDPSDDLVPFDLLCLTWGLGEISLPWFNCCATRATDTCSARFLARARAAPGPAGIPRALKIASPFFHLFSPPTRRYEQWLVGTDRVRCNFSWAFVDPK